MKKMRKMTEKSQAKSKIVWTVVRVIVIIVAGALLGFNVYTLNAERVAHNDLPMPFGRGLAIVLSGSMEPELSVDDLIIVKKADSFKKNDVVVFHEDGVLVVHRIVSIDGQNVVTKGDANDTEDAPITVDDVEGIVTGHIPGVGGVVRFLKSPVGIIMVIAIAVVLLELSMRKEKDRDDKQLDLIKEEIEKLKNGDNADNNNN